MVPESGTRMGLWACYTLGKGSDRKNPIGKECPINTFCEIGSEEPQFCSSGEFSPNSGAGLCSSCPDGFECPSDDQTETLNLGDCPPGSFCVGGQAEECTAGTFVASSNAANIDHCSECPAGYFCLRGATEFLNNICPERYFCPSGTGQEVPFDNRCTPGPGSLDRWSCYGSNFNFRSFRVDGSLIKVMNVLLGHQNQSHVMREHIVDRI